jgi:hypothetical protein
LAVCALSGYTNVHEWHVNALLQLPPLSSHARLHSAGAANDDPSSTTAEGWLCKSVTQFACSTIGQGSCRTAAIAAQNHIYIGFRRGSSKNSGVLIQKHARRGSLSFAMVR